MSNVLEIEVMEIRTVGGQEPRYQVKATDSYAEVFDEDFASLAELKAKFPTQRALVEHVLAKDAFFGGGEVLEDGTVQLDSITAIDIEGMPEDGSITGYRRVR